MEICRLLIQNTVDKNPFLGGWSPFHLAAERGHAEISKLLMECIDNKNPEDYDGNTSLHNAANNGHLDVRKEIIQYLDDINPKDNN